MILAAARRLAARVRGRDEPLDYTREGNVPEDGARGPAVVIVPVYGAAAELRRCLASLALHTDWGQNGLRLIIDGPQSSAVEEAIEESLPRFGAGVASVLRNPERVGFVGSVNRGMAASTRDVVLLNSDTEVTAAWLAKLQAAAYSSSAVATVTPFSNDASLVSLPQGFAANAIPAGYDVDSFGRLVEQVARREYPRLPTGVGLCLYIKRKALLALGLFDEARFGLGYGEENDFCFRALKAGYVHVLDDATFVYHAGHRSFGSTRASRVRGAERRLATAHPDYSPTIARFMQADPLRPLRARVLEALVPARRPRSGPGPARVLHVAQGWPPFNHAGTEVYARGLAVRQAQWREVAAHVRHADEGQVAGEATELLDAGVRVRLVVNNFAARDPSVRNALRNPALERDFARFLDETRPDLVHVHHLIGHSLGLVDAVAARGLPLVLQLQDWWLLCARANLLRPDRTLCPGPALGRCARCLPLTRVPPAAIWTRLLYAWRGALARRVIGRADALVMGSRFVAESFRKLGFLDEGSPIHVLPYGIDVSERTAPARAGAHPVRFGVLGSMMPHKGIHVAVEAFADVDPARATLDVWGDAAASPEYTRELRNAASPAVRFLGRFPESEKADRLSSLDVLVVPSLGLESFGLVVREAMALGVPVLASRRGALAEAFEDGACGAFFEPGDAGALRGWIDRLVREPAILAAWSRRMPAVKTMDAHAEEVEGVYAEVLRLRAGR